MPESSETKWLIGVLVLTVAVIAGGAWFFGRNGAGPGEVKVAANDERLVRPDSPFVGPAEAKVTIVEFSDFECPACGAVQPMMKGLEKKYEGQPVRLVYRHFPLPSHPDAPLAAEASMAAQAQGKFWLYHDWLFKNQDKLKRDDLISYAKETGLDAERFVKELDEGVYKASVEQGISDGQSLQVRGTPTFFINGATYSSNYTQPEMEKAIDAALK